MTPHSHAGTQVDRSFVPCNKGLPRSPWPSIQPDGKSRIKKVRLNNLGLRAALITFVYIAFARTMFVPLAGWEKDLGKMVSSQAAASQKQLLMEKEAQVIGGH